MGEEVAVLDVHESVDELLGDIVNRDLHAVFHALSGDAVKEHRLHEGRDEVAAVILLALAERRELPVPEREEEMPLGLGAVVEVEVAAEDEDIDRIALLPDGVLPGLRHGAAGLPVMEEPELALHLLRGDALVEGKLEGARVDERGKVPPAARGVERSPYLAVEEIAPYRERDGAGEEAEEADLEEETEHRMPSRHQIIPVLAAVHTAIKLVEIVLVSLHFPIPPQVKSRVRRSHSLSYYNSENEHSRSVTDI